MRKIFVIMMLVLAAAILMGSLPTQEHGVYTLSMGISHQDYTFFLPFWGMKYDTSEYIDRFGVFPTMPLWTNVDADSTILAVHLRYCAEPSWQRRFEPWDPEPKWSDYKDNLVLILESVKTGTRDTLTWGGIGTGNVEVPADPFFGNQINLDAETDAYRLPIPADSSAWKVWTELWEVAGQPESRMQLKSGTTIFVKAPLETATDSLTYLGAVSPNDTAYLHAVQRAFPTNFAVTSMLFDFYYLDENCDSVSALGNRMFAIWDTSSLPTLRSADFSPEERLLEKMNDICVDGYAQPKKYYQLIYDPPDSSQSDSTDR